MFPSVQKSVPCTVYSVFIVHWRAPRSFSCRLESYLRRLRALPTRRKPTCHVECDYVQSTVRGLDNVNAQEVKLAWPGKHKPGRAPAPMSRSRLADDERSRVLMSCHGAFLALLVYKYFVSVDQFSPCLQRKKEKQIRLQRRGRV